MVAQRLAFQRPGLGVEQGSGRELDLTASDNPFHPPPA